MIRWIGLFQMIQKTDKFRFVITSTIYRVFNKEGQKVLGYKTHKKCVFEAFKMLIASKNMGHFDIQSSFFKKLA